MLSPQRNTDFVTPEPATTPIVAASKDLANPVLLNGEMARLLTPALRCARYGQHHERQPKIGAGTFACRDVRRRNIHNTRRGR